jgi:acyl-coenzyme A thioesterase PaaI-like protein
VDDARPDGPVPNADRRADDPLERAPIRADAPWPADGPSLQERYAPGLICFGCGPANEQGLRIRSLPAGNGEVVATWTAQPQHQAFPGMLNGGIAGALLDCHSNWTATYHLMRQAGLDHPPSTVTADYHVRFRRPTPTDGPLTVRARVVDSDAERATVEATLEAGGGELRLVAAQDALAAPKRRFPARPFGRR